MHTSFTIMLKTKSHMLLYKKNRNRWIKQAKKRREKSSNLMVREKMKCRREGRSFHSSALMNLKVVNESRWVCEEKNNIRTKYLSKTLRAKYLKQRICTPFQIERFRRV